MKTLCRCKPLLGTYVEITASGDVEDAALIAQIDTCFKAVEYIHNHMNFHDPNSTLSKINRHAYQKNCTINSHFYYLLQVCTRLYQDSNALFDPSFSPNIPRANIFKRCLKRKPEQYGDWSNVQFNENKIRFTRPIQIDFGGIAKGYAVDFALSKKQADIDLIINAGGDIAMSEWRTSNISIRTNKNTLIDSYMLAPAVASSANTFTKFGHIYQPKSSKAIKRNYTVSVFAKKCVIADALTKILWLSPDCKNILDKYQAIGMLIDTGTQSASKAQAF